MSESKLTKYFREQVEGTEQNVDINSLTDAFIKSRGGTVNQNELLTHLKSQGFTAGQVLDFLDKRFGKALDPHKGRELRVSNLLNKSWFQLPQSVRDKIPNKRFDWDVANDTQRQNILAQAGQGSGTDDSGEARLSPMDKFETEFNKPDKCASCGLSRKQHENGGIGHTFVTRKQSRSNSLEIRSGKDWEALADNEQEHVNDFVEQVFEDNMEEFPNLSQNDLLIVGKKWGQIKPSVRDIILTGAARLAGVEATDEKEFWNTATSGQKRRIAVMLDINANVRWEQLTPAEQGSLAVWWDEGGGSKSIGGSEVDQAEVSRFLDGLRDSGVTNMFGAGKFIEKEFGVNRQEATSFLTTWMRNFSGEGRAEQLLDQFQKQFGEDAPQDAEGALNFLRLAGIPKEEAKRAIQNAGGALESFYNYDGAETLDSRAEEPRTASEGLVNIDTTGGLFHNVLSQLSALAPIQNFTIKAQFTDGKTGLIILSFDKSKDQKMMVDILKGVMKTNGVTKVTSTEGFASEGQTFTVTQDGTMLPKGNYEVLGKKTDQAHSGPWGTFSITTVKNLETGERHEIPTGNAQLIYGIN